MASKTIIRTAFALVLFYATVQILYPFATVRDDTVVNSTTSSAVELTDSYALERKSGERNDDGKRDCDGCFSCASIQNSTGLAWPDVFVVPLGVLAALALRLL